MKDATLVENIRVRYYKEHHTPHVFIKDKTVEKLLWILLIVTILGIGWLWIFGEVK